MGKFGYSLSELRDVSHTLKPDYIFTILQDPLPRQSIQHYVDNASKSVNGSELLLTGAQLFLNQVKLPENVKVLNGLPDTLQFLESLGGWPVRRIHAEGHRRTCF